MNTYGYKLHDWLHMSDAKAQKVIKAHKIYQARKKRLQALGYEFFQSLKAGPNSTYSWRFNGKDSAYGCESEQECIMWIEIEHGLKDVPVEMEVKDE